MSSLGGTVVRPVRAKEPITLYALLEQFDRLHLSTLRDPRVPRSKMRCYLYRLPNVPLASLTVMDLTAWANEIRAHSSSQARSCVKILRQVYTKAIEWDLYDGPNLAERVTAGRAIPRKSFIRLHEMPPLLEVLERYCSVDERCYFLTMLTLFPRPGEVDVMRIEDLRFWVDQQGHTVGLWSKPTTKNGQPHTVPIPTQLATLLQSYLQTRYRQDSPWVFPGAKDRPRSKEAWIYRWWEIRSVAGLDHITRHDLRRTGSSWASAETGDLASVSKGGLNHSDLHTTSIYVQPMESAVKSMYEKHEVGLRGPAKKLSFMDRLFSRRPSPVPTNGRVAAVPPAPKPAPHPPARSAEPRASRAEEWPG